MAPTAAEPERPSRHAGVGIDVSALPVSRLKDLGGDSHDRVEVVAGFDRQARRRERDAYHARWEQGRAARDREAVRWQQHLVAASRWRAAVSTALDDRLLATAVDRVTTPVAGLDRRSVPVARAQLVAWAAAVHRTVPQRPLGDALTDDLSRPALTVAVTLDGELPPAPSVHNGAADDLTDRLTRLFERRPDLDRPPREVCGRAPGGHDRALGEGVGHGR